MFSFTLFPFTLRYDLKFKKGVVKIMSFTQMGEMFEIFV